MSGAHILVIEDDEVLSEVIQKNLRIRNYYVESATDGKTALERLRNGHYDLVLLDIHLPDQTGWDILRSAAREQLLPPLTNDSLTLPVIVLSAVRVSSDRLAEFHPLAYLPKPFPMESLLRLAADAADRHQLHLEEEEKGQEDA